MRQGGLLRCASPIVKSLLLPMPSEMRARDRVRACAVFLGPEAGEAQLSVSTHAYIHTCIYSIAAAAAATTAAWMKKELPPATVPPLHSDRRALTALRQE
jgi:hypothetical protein